MSLFIQMLNNTPTGFDQDGAFDYMRKKYGTGDSPSPEKKPRQKSQRNASTAPKKETSKEEGSPAKRRRRDSSYGGGGGGGNRDTSPDFSPKKYEIVAVEDNRPIVEAIKELGALHFRHNEPKKGGKCSIKGQLRREQ